MPPNSAQTLPASATAGAGAGTGGIRRRRRGSSVDGGAPALARDAPDDGAASAGSSDPEEDAPKPEHHLPALKAAPMPQHRSYFGQNFKNQPWLKRLNWLHVPLLVSTPLMALYGVVTTEWRLATLAWAVAYYFYTGLGITAGYHRLWAHCAYKASRIVEVLLMLAGAGAVEGSIRWWCRDHRAHHRYVDTSKDPYAVTNGFFYAHMGWMLVKQDKTKIGRADITDLNEDPMVRFQHTYYLPLALFMGFVFPTLVAGIGWGDYRGGFFLAGVARLVFVHHSTFFVNSLAHYWGDQTYSDGHTAKNSIITAVLTLGEGYHNAHHEWPMDYRNGFRWYHYDPTKWTIRALNFFGLTHHLRRTPRNAIRQAMVQMKQRTLDKEAARVDWGPPEEELEEFTMERVKREVETGAQLVVLDGHVLDVTHFREQHPGGILLIASHLGEDITQKFGGAFYKHSNAANNLARMLRVGKVVPSKA